MSTLRRLQTNMTIVCHIVEHHGGLRNMVKGRGGGEGGGQLAKLDKLKNRISPGQGLSWERIVGRCR